SVAFEDDRATSPVTASTSDYIYSQKKEWTFVATCFDMVDESGHDQREREDAELLGLCDWFEEEKKRPVLNDDSDDHIPYEIFAEQGMRIRYQDPTSKSSLSSLRLNSLLRLESRPRISAAAAASQFVQIEEEENTLENQKTLFRHKKRSSRRRSRGFFHAPTHRKPISEDLSKKFQKFRKQPMRMIFGIRSSFK
uniref:Uncharacterized protein n=1 Tax=Caenorhabditis japonica TaxID=281687 RepID=A0A8R1IGS9_CAEJA